MTCVRSGASWIDGSRRSMPSLSPQRAAMRPQGGCRPSPVSEPSTPRRWWRPSATRGVLLTLAISRPGSGLSRDKPPPATGPGCSALPSAGTNTSARCWLVLFVLVAGAAVYAVLIGLFGGALLDLVYSGRYTKYVDLAWANGAHPAT